MYGEVLMRCASMWISWFALMRALMNLQSFVELERLLQWTARAMYGSVLFEDALAARLNLFNPSRSQVQDFLEKRPPSLLHQFLGYHLKMCLPINFCLEVLGSFWVLTKMSTLLGVEEKPLQFNK